MKRLICRILGHRHKCVTGRAYVTVSRDGRCWTNHGYYFHCDRCGMGEPDCWSWGWVEWLHRQWNGLLWAIEETKRTPPEDDGLPF